MELPGWLKELKDADVESDRPKCSLESIHKFNALVDRNAARLIRIAVAQQEILDFWRYWRKSGISIGNVPTQFLLRGDDLIGRADAALRGEAEEGKQCRKV